MRWHSEERILEALRKSLTALVTVTPVGPGWRIGIEGTCIGCWERDPTLAEAVAGGVRAEIVEGVRRELEQLPEEQAP